MIKKILSIIVFLIVLTGCVSHGERIAKIRNPECKVTIIEENDYRVKALVECIGADPKIKRYRLK